MEQQQDEIRNLLQVNDQKSQGSIRVESDILEPSSVSQKQCIFTIRKAGILSNDSRFILPLYASNTTTRLTCFGGAYGMLERVTLRTASGNTIAQTDQVNFLASMRNHFVSQEIREKVGKYKNGTFNVFGYGINTSNTNEKGVLQLSDINKEGNDIKMRHRLFNNADDRVEYVISLQECFPELFPYSIPLFTLESNVQLVLDFSDDGPTGVRAVASTGVATDIGNVLIDTANIKFISDHIFMKQETFDRILAMTRSQQGLVVPYADYQTVTLVRNAPADAVDANKKETIKYNDNIGMANLRLKHILIHTQIEKTDQHPSAAQSIAGKYASSDSYAGVGGQKYQFNINNENYYNQDLETQEFYKELSDVYGTDAEIPYPIYTAIPSVSDGKYGDTSSYAPNKFLVTDATFFGVSQAHALVGQACIAGVNWCNTQQRANTGFNGVEVSNAPITISYQRDYTAAEGNNIKTRYFACIERLMSIKYGQIENNFS